jgi:hypothetical protein
VADQVIEEDFLLGVGEVFGVRFVDVPSHPGNGHAPLMGVKPQQRDAPEFMAL